MASIDFVVKLPNWCGEITKGGSTAHQNQNPELLR
jgi:hypothetical protein